MVSTSQAAADRPTSMPTGDEAILALQKQLADLRDQMGQLDGQRVAEARVTACERGLSIVAAVLGELHTNAAKSDLTALLAELNGLVKPMRERTEAGHVVG